MNTRLIISNQGEDNISINHLNPVTPDYTSRLPKDLDFSKQLNLSCLSPGLPQPTATPKSDMKLKECLSPSVPSYKGAANFRIRTKMGEGAVGEVYQVVHKSTLEVFALKRCNKNTATMVSINQMTFELSNDDAHCYYFNKGA